jgi:hypothetical protein
MIGYYYKSQPIPKPIYKNNRIILNKYFYVHKQIEYDNTTSDRNSYKDNNNIDTDYDNFINANLVSNCII